MKESSAKTVETSKERQLSYERESSRFDLSFSRYPKFIEEFKEVEFDTQMALLRAQKQFTEAQFIAYYILMKDAGFPAVSIIQDRESGFASLYKKLSRNIEIKCPIEPVEEDFFKKFIEIFSTFYEHRHVRGVMTILYVARAMYGEEVVREYTDRVKSEAPTSTLIDMVALLPHWNSVRDSHLTWAISLYPADVVEPSKNVV